MSGMDILEELKRLSDPKYADFQAKLTPGIPRERFLGVRVPDARKLAKQSAKDPDATAFLNCLPHDFFDENMLHALLIAQLQDFGEAVTRIEQFLPYVDNWAVCDSMRPMVFRQNKGALLPRIKEWCKSSHVYTCRFGLEMLMTFYLDGDFRPEYLEIPAKIQSQEYYVNMMIAWFFATALAKQWDAAIPYLQGHRLSDWVHRKTIQKAVESFRITPEQKAYLKTLR